jgi:hypothetical protein
VGSQRLTAWAMAWVIFSPISSPLTTRRVAVEVFDPASTRVKLIPVTGRGGPQDCETSRLPHFLNNRLRAGSEVASFTRRRSSPPGRFEAESTLKP